MLWFVWDGASFYFCFPDTIIGFQIILSTIKRNTMVLIPLFQADQEPERNWQSTTLVPPTSVGYLVCWYISTKLNTLPCPSPNKYNKWPRDHSDGITRYDLAISHGMVLPWQSNPKPGWKSFWEWGKRWHNKNYTQMISTHKHITHL